MCEQTPKPAPLDHIHEKLKRADEHIRQLHQEIHAFFGGNQRDLIDYEPDAGQAFRDFHLGRPLPARFSIITGETIHQLRSSLDHMVYALVLRDGGAVTPHTQFPMSRVRPVKEKAGRYDQQIHGIKRQEVRDIIETCQPYHRDEPHWSRQWLGVLHDLDITDKHRALILQVPQVSARVRTKMVSPGWFEIEELLPDDPANPRALTYSRELPLSAPPSREMRPSVALEWGDTGKFLEVCDTLSQLREAVARIIDSLSPYLG